MDVLKKIRKQIKSVTVDGVEIFDRAETVKWCKKNCTAKLKDFDDCDRVIGFVARVSGSYSTWCKFSNQYHGYVLTAMSVEVMDDGQRVLAPLGNEKYSIRLPIGKENTMQQVNIYDNMVVCRLSELNEMKKIERSRKCQH
jgi:hypothetical protein